MNYVGRGEKCDVLTFEIPVYVEIIGEWFTGEALEKFQEIEACYISNWIDRYFTGAGSNCERLKSFILKHDAVYLRWIWCIRVRSRGSGRGMDRVDLQRDRRFENEKSFFHRRKKGKRRIIKWFVDEIKCERERDVESEDETWQFWTVLLPRLADILWDAIHEEININSDRLRINENVSKDYSSL